MRDLKERLRAKFTRRSPIPSSLSSTDGDLVQGDSKSQNASVGSLLKALKSFGGAPSFPGSTSVFGRSHSDISLDSERGCANVLSGGSHESPTNLNHPRDNPLTRPNLTTTPLTSLHATSPRHEKDDRDPVSYQTPQSTASNDDNDEEADEPSEAEAVNSAWDPRSVLISSSEQRPGELMRRQSLLPTQQSALINALLDIGKTENSEPGNTDGHNSGVSSTINGSMMTRKIWVRRPNSSATLVTINEDDLVDDVREMILKKYANSLGRNFDPPDVTLKMCSREHRQERILGPEEPMARTIDLSFPGGQTVHEALIIDVPVRRTPRQSPMATLYYHDEVRPSETGTDYFPPMPVAVVPSPHHQNGISVPPSTTSGPHSMSVLSTGHVPNLPSPGGRRYNSRPRVARVPTSSPSIGTGQQTPSSAIINGTVPSLRGRRSRAHSLVTEHAKTPPITPRPPTPPTVDATAPEIVAPVARVSSPLPGPRPKKPKKLITNRPSLPAGMLNGAAVPPINVLIVEDNIINLKLLEAFMKRLKVRWQTAMNGKEAMTKWRAGGFHLVLMDIQLPVMNGLEATREIRRLEKLNGIGVFSSSASSTAPEQVVEPQGEDKLPTTVLFKSPVIIVALTASSLQSDRHEALAAGCNDFLTKVSPLSSPPLV